MASVFNHVRLAELKPWLRKINELAPKMRALSDQALKNYTPQLKARLAQGAKLSDLLPEAFSLVREADRRILGLFPYDVQVLGALALYFGAIAEMKTGEGKTLTATMPLYLWGLTGQGAMLVTPNEYLAERDEKEMGQVYEWLGLKVALGFAPANQAELSPSEKRERYQADILYTTSSVYGFDYLLDNLAVSPSNQFMRRFSYCIVDEADAVLLDMATTPLVIAGGTRINSHYIGPSDEVVTMLEANRDFRLDDEENNVWLTSRGIQAVEQFFDENQLYDGEHHELVRRLTLSLRAHELLKRDRDYVVSPNQKIILLDRSNGRMLPGMRLQAGLHQAIEMKEQVPLSQDQRPLASITYQNLFRQFAHLAGMTATAKAGEQEFIETYYCNVIQIPTNKKSIRQDLPDRVFPTLTEKLLACLDRTKELHQTGQPVLVISNSVEISEIFSELLLQAGIPHNLLNAKSEVKEAAIIKEAGQKNAVTVATKMAGRGTDIKLGPGVAELGGLAVLIMGQMPSKRIDQQLRGRAGRQGDPGSSQFFKSLEDEVVQRFGPRWLRQKFEYLRDQNFSSPRELHGWRLHLALRHVQETSDQQAENERSRILEMDESVKMQRELVYRERSQLLHNWDQHLDIAQLLNAEFRRFYQANQPMTAEKLQRYILNELTYRYYDRPTAVDLKSESAVVAYLNQIANKELATKAQELGSKEELDNFYRYAILKAIDESWLDEVDTLEQLRLVVSSRQTAQRNPLYEYHEEALAAFQKMQVELNRKVTRFLLLSTVQLAPNGDKQIYFN
ncbi:accessory Sec system translocase SecA2 [Lactobacillus corticis]|uniref:Protein translocase subunit SecA n=1 Tax=Lactobacillus corticis TaxID=2201249 RepID=A0A916VHG4_9LACO|nr:accessory Sec system translocase SecA2 [Lactobacillus corticis]GFZ26612.1 preprotein translocase subunit SecA [Lactobacillus corticis]